MFMSGDLGSQWMCLKSESAPWSLSVAWSIALSCWNRPRMSEWTMNINRGKGIGQVADIPVTCQCRLQTYQGKIVEHPMLVYNSETVSYVILEKLIFRIKVFLPIIILSCQKSLKIHLKRVFRPVY